MSNMMIQNFIMQHKKQQQHPTVSLPAISTRTSTLNYKTFIKGASTLPADGKLVKGSLLGISDLFTYNKKLKKEFESEVGDYKLGKFNNVAMRASALALAGYLAINRALPVKKGMEFIGAGAFFASMALWPKIFIQAPTQLYKGFNINQKWEDSKGRQNDFFRDPNYIPWDLMTPEYINKVGDRMGVDKNIENRESLIKDKMRKTAIQANTLWMLTAGFATPIMGALIASKLEDPLSGQIEKNQVKNIIKKVENYDQSIKKNIEKQAVNSVEEILTSNKGQEVDKTFVDRILSKMQTTDVELNSALKKDIASVLEIKTPEKTADLFDNALNSKIFKDLGVSKADIEAKLKSLGIQDDINLSSAKRSSIKDALLELWHEKHTSLKANRIQLNKMNQVFEAEIDKSFEVNTKSILSDDAINSIKKIEETIKNYNATRSVVDDLNQVFIGNKEDSVVARKWNRSIKKVVKSLGLTSKELDMARRSPDAARDILDKKFTEIAADEARYKKVLQEVATAIDDFDSFVTKKHIKINGSSHSIGELITSKAEKMFNTTAEKMKEHVSGSQVENYINRNYAKSNYINELKNTLDGSVNTMYKFVHSLDFYKRLGSVDIKDSISEYLSHWTDKGVKKSGKSFEKGETAIKEMKRVLLEGSMGDHIVKFDIKDKNLFAAVMQDLFNSKKVIDPKTAEILNKAGLGNVSGRLKGIVGVTAKELCDLFDKFNPANTMDAQIKEDLSEMLYKVEPKARQYMANKQARLGDALASTFKKAVEPIINTKKWNKMFAGFGLGLAAVTVVAPLFFGRIKVDKGGNK